MPRTITFIKTTTVGLISILLTLAYVADSICKFYSKQKQWLRTYNSVKGAYYPVYRSMTDTFKREWNRRVPLYLCLPKRKRKRKKKKKNNAPEEIESSVRL